MTYDFITSEQILSLAFSDGEYISPTTIAQSDIDASIERWVVPVVGRRLIDAAATGAYPTLVEEYLSPAIAACVRLDVQARLNVATSQLGLTVLTGSNNRQADVDMRAELMCSLRHKAHSLLRRLTDHLEQQPPAYAEYVAAANVLNRCQSYGGFVQVS